jgi:polyribonucleotide nucleotidyltransferase
MLLGDALSYDVSEFLEFHRVHDAPLLAPLALSCLGARTQEVDISLFGIDPLSATSMLLLLPSLASITFNVGATHRPSALPRVGPPVRLSVTPATPLGEGEWEVIKEGGAFYGRASQSKLRVNVAGKEMTFGTGLIARQANAAVTVEQGQTHVFSAACFERKTDFEAIDFTPLKVDYFERQSAAGRTLGGYIKRDGKPSNHETLTSRLIDRPIRPLIAKGWSLETQLTAYVLAYDGTHMPDVLAILASSAALALSEVPFPKPVAAVRVGLIEERRPERPAPAAATDDAVSDGAASDDAGAGAGAGAAEEDDFLDELILDEQVTSEISEISEISVISSDCLPHQL